MTLNILVVEDDGDKLRRILRTLQEVEGIDKDLILNARDCLAAKKLMREKFFDLVILDIALPAAPDVPPTPDGGITLLQEVLDREIYRRPREVVGLTAFPDVRESAGPKFAEDLW
jgi:CheY-like chemotaxis protein